jgi:UMF1 family MFS transporter
VLFDWAAQPYFTLITTFVFAPYFATRLADNPVAGQALWGYATAAAGLVIALASPPLGAIADAAGRRKPWIFAFSVVLVAASLALWYAAPGAGSAVAIALGAFAIGTIAVEFATVFTNAMMPDLVPAEKLGRLSGIGWATGYAGGLVSLVIAIGFLAADPETGRTLLGLAPLFGLDPATFAGDRASGPLTAIWYVVFVVPLFLFTPDTPRRMGLAAAVRSGLAEMAATLRGLGAHANMTRFLVANLVYHDGLVALFAFGGIYAAGTFGWSAIELGLFGILLTITGTVGALAGGWLDDRLGSRAVISGSLIVLVVACVAIVSIDARHVLFVVPVAPPGGGLFDSIGEQAYLVIGAVIGAVAGPLQASSRTLMARLAPPGKTTQSFGLFALSGKVTSFAGPLAVALITWLAQSQRIGVSAIIAFFVAGAILIVRVAAPDKRGA